MAVLKKPRIRYLEAFPHRQDEQFLVVLRDPFQINSELLVISPELYSILPMFDGERTLKEIQAELSKDLSESVQIEHLQKIVDTLDKAYFLDNARFQNRYREVLDSFRKAHVRKAFHAGTSYPAEAPELEEKLSSFYTCERGAGLPDGKKSTGGGKLVGLIAPHIDLRSGGSTYSHAYRVLGESPTPDLFVILGTGHMGLPEFFSIADKDFETPLGVSPVDRQFLAVLRRHLGPDLFLEDLTHRNEHTIEFQLVFLQHLLGASAVRFVPVLTSFSYRDLAPGGRGEKLFLRFIEAFRRALDESKKSVCFIASADLAHMGPRYGDSAIPDDRLIGEVRAKDQEMLDLVAGADAESFFKFVEEEKDRRRICGFSPILTLLHLVDGVQGRLLAHDQALMDPTRSFVTYASLVLEERR